MTYLQLKPQVGFGLVGGRPIFLDLERDRYFTLAVPAAAAFERLRHDGGAVSNDDEGMASLLASNLFQAARSPQPFAPARVPAPAPSRAMEAGRVHPRIFDIPEASLLLFRARRALRTGSLARSLSAQSAGSPTQKAEGDSARLASLANRFLAVRDLVPVAPSCLLDSLALSQWLRRRSAPASLIFGVKLDPFAAHCWVQAEDLVLNDAPDRIAEFTPVLVLT